MIDINELKQGDVLTTTAGNIYKFICIYNNKLCLEFKDKIDTYSNTVFKNNCTSWKRDGVELLKQEEEKPLYVFCPIEKNDECFYVNCVNLPCETTCFRVDAFGLLTRFGDYTFIGYSTNNENPKPLVCKSPLDYCFRDDLPKVAKYAVFIRTSKLHVVGDK